VNKNAQDFTEAQGSFPFGEGGPFRFSEMGDEEGDI
jgi:hypothetical protein